MMPDRDPAHYPVMDRAERDARRQRAKTFLIFVVAPVASAMAGAILYLMTR
ncbi:MAG: hypothetical protein ABFD89_09215 [Bryobacteraceae bacterium]